MNTTRPLLMFAFVLMAGCNSAPVLNDGGRQPPPGFVTAAHACGLMGLSYDVVVSGLGCAEIACPLAYDSANPDQTICASSAVDTCAETLLEAATCAGYTNIMRVRCATIPCETVP